MKKLILVVVMGMLLVGCSGKQVGDSFTTEEGTCTTTMQYRWVWALIGKSGMQLVPVTKCVK